MVSVEVDFSRLLREREAGASVETARTVAVDAIVIREAFCFFSTSYPYRGVLNRDGRLGHGGAPVAVAVVVLLQVAFPCAPAMWTFVQGRPLDAGSRARIVAFGSLAPVLVEIEKSVIRRRRAGAPR